VGQHFPYGIIHGLRFRQFRLGFDRVGFGWYRPKLTRTFSFVTLSTYLVSVSFDKFQRVSVSFGRKIAKPKKNQKEKEKKEKCNIPN